MSYWVCVLTGQNVSSGCKYLRAKQNAERLHGQGINFIQMNSLISHVASNTMTKTKNKREQKQSSQKKGTINIGTNKRRNGDVPGGVSRAISFRPETTVVSNSEIIASAATILSTASYTTTFPVAPTYFTWLGAVAGNYSKFKFTKFRVSYIPSVGTTVAGNVSMAFGYDMGDVFPTNSGGIVINGGGSLADNDAIVNLRPSIMLSAWEEGSIDFPRARMKENRFMDNIDWAPGLLTSDAAFKRNWGSDGYVLVSAVGPANTILGKIHIEYTVELYDPIRAALN